MTPSELLGRLATTLKEEIGPAVEADYPRTQAFLTSVVLQKLSRQLRLAEDHASADRRDRDALERDLRGLLDEVSAPPQLHNAFKLFSEEGGNASLCRFIETLYASRAELGANGFDILLTRVRATLRARLDRQMEVAS